jgi:hypothetical protein
MTELKWLDCSNPGMMLDYLEHLGHHPQGRMRRLLVTACLRRVWDWLIETRSRQAVQIAERFADGFATEAELQRAREAVLQLFSELCESLPDDAYRKMYALPPMLLGWMRVSTMML